MLSEAQGCVFMVVGVGRRKFQFLQHIPYLFAKLGEPGVRDEVLKQWEAKPAATRHPASHVLGT